MIAADHDTVRELNHRAHLDNQTHNPDRWDHLVTASGETISVGDTVITRRNNRTLTTGTSWVKNGDTWTVTAISRHGDVTVQRADTADSVALPADYAAEHLDLGYAITAHQAQGRTLDTAHAAITDTTTREQLYVMTTRARTANHLYLHPPDDTHGVTQASSDDLLIRSLTRIWRNGSATEAINTAPPTRPQRSAVKPVSPEVTANRSLAL